MDTDLLMALRKQAKDMGYGSAPAYVRAWAIGAIKQLDETNRLQFNQATSLALHYIELLLAARTPQALNTDAALDYVRRQLVARSWREHMQKLGFRDRS